MTPTQEKLTIEEFQQFLEKQPNTNMRYELVNGEIVEKPLSPPPDSTITANIIGEFQLYLKQNPVGYVTALGGYCLVEQTVRTPDVGFISRQRYPEIGTSFIEAPPNIAIEVISASESAKTVSYKIIEYFGAGVEIVWSVYPETKKILMWRIINGRSQAISHSDKHETISLAPVLPDFSIKLRDIFNFS